MTKRVAPFDGDAAAAITADNLDKPSRDNEAMRPYWDQVETIVQGASAMKLAGKKYLPMFPDEDQKDFEFRLELTKFTNVYRDIVEGLASRPFESNIELAPEVPEEIKTFCDNVDGAYNSLTVFGASTFFNGINEAIDWIFVDYPKAPIGPALRSKADEAAAGIKPFWSRIIARNVLEVRSEVIGGDETFTYFRIYEPGEKSNFVRIMLRLPDGTCIWQLWEQDTKHGPATSANGGTTKWNLIDQGDLSIGMLPMVPFVVGRRRGRTQYYFPAMRDAADLQIELYLEESGLKHISTLAGFPMLAANGVKPQMMPDNKTPKRLRFGPSATLYAPPDGAGNSGTWQLLEPSATSMTFLQSKIERTVQQLRELGRNPLTAQSGNLTVVTTMVAAKKGNSAVQMWALSLEDALDNALMLTGMWLGMPKEAARKIKCKVFTDFGVESETPEALTALTTMREKGDISQRTLWKEMKRRDILGPEFDPDDEEQALLDEGPPDMPLGVDPATGIDPLTGRALAPPAKPGGKVPPDPKA